MSEQFVVGGDFPLDENVIAAIPDGAKVVSAVSYGSSAWTITASVSTELPDGTPRKYFLKCANGESGRKMMEGEFNAMTELYRTMPSFVPKPHIWGKYARTSPETYFFVADFIEMSNAIPEPVQFCARVAELHHTSQSPTGKFGFHIQTCHGKFPQVVDWDDNWASFFTKMFSAALELDAETNGRWKDLDDIASKTLTQVIPRLLGALQAEGRNLKPSLIHGDLWEGNTGTDLSTGDIYIFDAGAYYAHNEMELGIWRCERHRLKAKVYKKEYMRNFAPSEPEDEWEDRNRVYCVKFNIIHSAHHPGSIVRQTAYEDMCYLVDKYGSGQAPKN